MLLFRRSFAMPSIGAYYTLVDHAHPAFRVRIEHGRGVACDEAMMFPAVAWTGYGDRPRLVLRGRVRDVENGIVRWLAPGDFTIGRALDSLYMRIEGDEVLLLSIEYNLGSLGTSAPVGLPTGSLARSRPPRSRRSRPRRWISSAWSAARTRTRSSPARLAACSRSCARRASRSMRGARVIS